EIMLAALSMLGGRIDWITYFGDGSWDRDACEELGWEFVPVGSALNGLESFSVNRTFGGLGSASNV
ncbi:MAG: hypothetical protein R3358_06235, partial [Woeseiaceae bacterium]|nr:hypothetical protein [Woeseiaceae bacterium]